MLFERARLSSRTAVAPSAARPLPAADAPQPTSLPLPLASLPLPLASLPLPLASLPLPLASLPLPLASLPLPLASLPLPLASLPLPLASLPLPLSAADEPIARAAQVGELDFISFVNRFDKLQFQAVLHRLWTLLRMPGGLTSLRLGVEIHIGGHRDHAFFLKYTVPDLPLLRSALRAAGCRCNLVTLLRHPLLQHLSWHYHFVNHRVPLCFWSNPADCKARLAMGPTCHDGPNAVGPNAMGPTCHSEPPRRRRAAVATLRPSGRH